MKKIIRRKANGFTIDPIGARDLDDAIWLEQKDGKYIVHVSISDVASQIIKGSEEDQDARSKCFSRYYPKRVDHMIPVKFAEDKLSVYVTARQYGSLLGDTSYVEAIERLLEIAEEIIDNYVIEHVLEPLAQTIAIK